jgi:hypothetical protein
VKGVIVALLALFVAVTAASAANAPSSVATTGATGIATVSASGVNGWRVVVTTRPPGLRVRVQVAGRPVRVGKSPMRLDDACTGCSVRVAARLQPSRGKPVPASATLRLALYRR